MKIVNIHTIIFVVVLVVVGLGFYFYSSPAAEAPPIDLSAFSEPKYEISSETVVYHASTSGYLAIPAGEGPFPAVVLIHEWWGLNDNIRDLAEDFAAQGYVALAVDLYDGTLATTSEQAGALAGAVRDNVDGAFTNLSDAVAFLETQSLVDPDRIASVGWCFGGMWAYNMAVNDMGIEASVMYYGRFSLDDDLSMMRAHILGHFGEEDTSIAVDDVKQFEAKLRTDAGNHSVFIYPNAGHAFANEDREDAYNEEAATLAWARTMDFLSREMGE
jgi:carboxymethylenebutenolidase